MQRLIIAALETGCRRGELLKLQWRHVDVTRGRITLPAEITKTDEGRTVVISARLRPVLEMIRINPLTKKEHEAIAYVFGNGKASRSPVRKRRGKCAYLRLTASPRFGSASVCRQRVGSSSPLSIYTGKTCDTRPAHVGSRRVGRFTTCNRCLDMPT